MRHHDAVLVVDGAETASGERAVRRVLDDARPAGTSAAAWRALVGAAATTLAAG